MILEKRQISKYLPFFCKEILAILHSKGVEIDPFCFVHLVFYAEIKGANK